MVQTATHTLDLKSLEPLLQKRLHAELLDVFPLQVRCLLKEETLIIIVQHPAPVIPFPRRAFRILKQVLEEEQILGYYHGMLYLRVQEQNQPYAFHNININPQTRSEVREDSNNSSENEFEAKENFVPESNFSLPEDYLDRDETEAFNSISEDDDSASANFEVNPSATTTEVETEPKTDKISKDQALMPVIAVGTGISLLVFCTTFYLLTRPCVVGTCQAIPQAQQLAASSAKITQTSLSGQEIFQAQTQLNQAIKRLQTIPFWSPRRQEAENLVKVYQARAIALEQIVNALQKAAKASLLSQNPPLSLAKWQEVQNLWREVISNLEQIPADHEFYHFAQTKLHNYQQNLATINQRLKQEKQATADLKSAEEALKIADVRQGVAQSLPNWQLVNSTWETALIRLKNIPQGTTAYDPAQKLLQEYIPKMSIARDRKNQELFAANAYKQGVNLSELAKQAEATNQWSAAVQNWRNAIIYLQQVPEKSYQYKQAQSLLNSAEDALKKAEAKLKIVLRLQQVEKDLGQICTNKTTICTYTVAENRIQVRLTPSYVEEIRNTAIKAKAEANTATEFELLKHISSLEQALKVVSNNASLPLEVYDANNILLTSYNPSMIR